MFSRGVGALVVAVGIEHFTGLEEYRLDPRSNPTGGYIETARRSVFLETNIHMFVAVSVAVL